MGLFDVHIPKELKLHITLKIEQDTQTIKLLQEIGISLINVNNKIETLMSNTDLALSDIASPKALFIKIGSETSTLLQKIIDLQNNAPADTPQSVLDGLADLLA